MRDASLIYGDASSEVYAVREATLKISAGEFVGLLGPSGSGKSSLLYLLSGLKTPTRGEVAYNDLPYTAMSDRDRSRLRRARFGFVFQQPYLLGYLNSLENVLVAAMNARSRRDYGMELLERLGMADKAHRYPHSLSGGEKQRVCIARALINEPEVVFADEPTASLDHANGRAVVKLLETCRGAGAVVLVTHDPQMLEDAGRVYHVRDGQVES